MYANVERMYANSKLKTQSANIKAKWNESRS